MFTTAPVEVAGCLHGGVSAEESPFIAEDVAFAAVHLPVAGFAVLGIETSALVVEGDRKLGAHVELDAACLVSPC